MRIDMRFDKKKIPNGFYCYTYNEQEHFILCPYWRHRRDIDDKEVHSQNCGYCKYLGKGDLEMNAEDEYINDDGEIFTADKIGLPLSLLWDMCKMCNVNIDEE